MGKRPKNYKNGPYAQYAWQNTIVTQTHYSKWTKYWKLITLIYEVEAIRFMLKYEDNKLPESFKSSFKTNAAEEPSAKCNHLADY